MQNCEVVPVSTSLFESVSTCAASEDEMLKEIDGDREEKNTTSKFNTDNYNAFAVRVGKLHSKNTDTRYLLL